MMLIAFAVTALTMAAGLAAIATGHGTPAIAAWTGLATLPAGFSGGWVLASWRE